jgi:hypothetical protein
MFRRALLVVAAVSAAGALATPAGTLGASSKPTVYFKNLNSNTVKPTVLFFAADNGPRMVDIHWHGWSTHRAVGYGAWMARYPGSEGSEEELDVRPARLILTDPKVCDGSSGEPAVPHGTRFYTGFKLITWDGRYKKHVQRYHGC